MAGPQERALRTRAALLASAAREIDRHGFTGTSVNAILAGSGVTKGAFYFHFTSKDHLAVELVAATAAAFSPVLLAWSHREDDGLAVLLGVTDDVVALLMFDPLVRAGVRICAEGPAGVVDPGSPLGDWTRVLTRLLQRAERDGVLRAGVDPAGAAGVLLAAVLGQRWVSEQLSESADLWHRVRTTLALLLPALATDEWLARWRCSAWAAAGPPVPVVAEP